MADVESAVTQTPLPILRPPSRRRDRNIRSRDFIAGAQDELDAGPEARPPRWLSPDEATTVAGRDLATLVSDLDHRRVMEVLDGRSCVG
jgi:hypothetical protein